MSTVIYFVQGYVNLVSIQTAVLNLVSAVQLVSTSQAMAEWRASHVVMVFGLKMWDLPAFKSA